MVRVAVWTGPLQNQKRVNKYVWIHIINLQYPSPMTFHHESEESNLETQKCILAPLAATALLAMQMNTAFADDRSTFTWKGICKPLNNRRLLKGSCSKLAQSRMISLCSRAFPQINSPNGEIIKRAKARLLSSLGWKSCTGDARVYRTKLRMPSMQFEGSRSRMQGPRYTIFAGISEYLLYVPFACSITLYNSLPVWFLCIDRINEKQW